MSDSASSVPGTAPGERLRAERERRGFSTQKVAEDLHVDVWVVEALESGRHGNLGAPVYVKGHLRKYAVLLGLDGEALVSEACPEQPDPPLVLLRGETRVGNSRRWPLKPLLFAVGAVVIVAAAVWAYRWWSQREPAPAPPAKESAVAPSPADGSAPAAIPALERTALSTPQVQGATQSENRSATTAGTASAPAATAPATTPAGALVRESVRLRLSFSADSWVEVYDANQRRVFFDLGVADSARTFNVVVPARVFLGYADGVRVELEGRPVALADEVRRNNVAHFTIDARGRLQPAGSLTGR